MKYLLASLSILFFSFIFKGNEVPSSQVPNEVSTSFNQNFSSAEKLAWTKSKHGTYEAEFEILHMEYKAQFTKRGDLAKHKHDINLRSIPGVIAVEMAKNYNGYKVEKTEKLIMGSTTYYQVELEGSTSELKLVYTPTGKEAKKVDYWD